MYGRNGIDNLSKFIVKIIFILFLFNILFLNNIILIIELILILLVLYRVLSKNIYLRSRENRLYLSIKNVIKQPFKIIIKNYQDKNHVYKKCKQCKKILRLPLPEKRGIKHTKCPNCHKKIIIFTFKCEKVEIIT